MKKALCTLLALISFSSYAGDMYFVCEDEKNDDFLSITVDKGRARLLLLQEETPLLLDLKQLKSKKHSRYHLRVTNLKSHQSEVTELKIFEEVLFGTYACLVRD
jgi:hypothetical protein